jgi:short-subunit dehydrogenase
MANRVQNTAVITGASRGIGAATAARLARSIVPLVARKEVEG